MKMGQSLSKNHLNTITSNETSNVMDEHYGGYSRNDLDSHANIVVVGKHATILADNGNKVDVIPFTPDYQVM